MIYRHELGNDRWIAEQVFPDLHEGYFVEAGAGGGKHQSATYVLETELGWSGICVEPVDRLYELLTKTRSCATDGRCLWDRSGETVPFTQFPDKLPRSGIAEVNKNLEAQRAAGAAESVTSKRTVTLHDLLVEHGAPSTIHYLGLDIEGAERRVLEAFDLVGGTYRILAISIEGGSCDEVMERAGYVRTRNPFTDKRFERYFLHRDVAER